MSSAALPLRAQTPDDLTPAQRRTIAEGGQVFLTWSIEGSAWPRACVYQRIDATPEEAAAVFTNYERHLAFIPNLREARISRVIDPLTAEVDYTLHVPIVSDEHYTVRDRLSTRDSGASYRIDWTLVRASSAKATEGGVRFERALGDGSRPGGTLMSYCNFVTPGAKLAGLGFIRSRAMAQVREAAQSIVTEVERERAGNRVLLDTELRALRSSLAAERPPRT